MSIPLVEALGQVDLEAGRVYRFEVKGQLVELRVLGPAEVPPVSVFDESDVMRDPRVEFPRPTSGIAGARGARLDRLAGCPGDSYR